jgi:hypothetical protein
LATVLPSILRLRAMFHPKFAVRETIKRPPDWAAVPIEVAQTKTKIKKSLMVEVKFELMGTMLRFAHPALSSALLQAAACQKRLKILLSSGLAFG